MTAILEAVHPVLMVKSVPAALAFYRQLGFEVAFTDAADTPRYAGVRRDHVELHLQWHDAEEWTYPNDRPTYRFVVADVDALFKEFINRVADLDRTEVRDTAWGTREFHVRDSDLNGLQFYRDRDIRVPPGPRGKMHTQVLSVGFADLTHYARATELLGAEQVVAFVQEGLHAAGDVLVRHGGRIRKYIGDGLLFTFSDAQAAAMAAREMANCYHREIGPLTLRYRVAVATGEVLVGPIGHPAFIQDDVMGQTVNRAARLLAEAGRSPDGYALCEHTRATIA